MLRNRKRQKCSEVPEEQRIIQKSQNFSEKIWSKYALILIFIRSLGALLQQTAYVPDEFYQSTDVIHNFVLNKTEVTWEWHYPIRTSLWLYPATILCRFINFLGFYSQFNVQTFLRLYTGVICAFGELIMINLATNLFSPETGESYFILAASSWYQFYSGSKALNNPVEVTLFSLTFSQLHKDGLKSSSATYLFFAGVSIFQRSSGFMCYLPVFIYHFWSTSNRLLLLIKTVKMVILVLTGGLLYDFWWFGRLTFSALNFVWVNVVDDVAVLFGHMGGVTWYLTQGFPVINGLCYPLGILGFLKIRHLPIIRVMALSILGGWLFMELGCAHKEFRYVHWSAPFFTICAAAVFKDLKNWVKFCFVAANLVAAGYMTLIHQRGGVDVSKYLQDSFCEKPETFIKFYGPCHFLPGEYARYCQNGHHLRIDQLKCDRLVKKDQTDVDLYHHSPAYFIDTDLKKFSKLPDRIIIFDGYLKDVQPVLDNFGYNFDQKFFHAHFPIDEQTENLLIFKL